MVLGAEVGTERGSSVDISGENFVGKLEVSSRAESLGIEYVTDVKSSKEHFR